MSEQMSIARPADGVTIALDGVAPPPDLPPKYDTELSLAVSHRAPMHRVAP